MTSRQRRAISATISLERSAKSSDRLNSSVVVPGRATRHAALEAVENEVPLVVILAEGVPHHDTAEILARARRRGVRVIGPNSQGMISPGQAKLGGTGGEFPERMFTPGPVGIVSRSGGMGGEIASALTRRGIGQSTYVSVGGDLLIGSGNADVSGEVTGDARIGSGRVLVTGSIGEDLEMEYTAVGDPVNLASRIEAMTRQHQVDILITQFTYELVKYDVDAEPLRLGDERVDRAALGRLRCGAVRKQMGRHDVLRCRRGATRADGRAGYDCCTGSHAP